MIHMFFMNRTWAALALGSALVQGRRRRGAGVSKTKMKRGPDYRWTAVGLFAVALSLWLLLKDLRGISFSDVAESFISIPNYRWLLALGSTLVAYGALAWYDRIGLAHLGHKLSWIFISIVSFTTYALSHNIGASVFSGAVVRYRAYSTRGLSVAEVGVLVAFSAFTFILGMVLLGGLVLTFAPQVADRWIAMPLWGGRAIGLAMLGGVALYIFGSLRHFAPFKIGSLAIVYPRPSILASQLCAAPLELIGAAGIIYFALPPTANPGFAAVLGIFLASFAVALASYAPGGVGVLEYCFLTSMPDAPKAEVLAALLAFRLLYLILPLIFAIIAVVIFERGRLREAWRHRADL
jgi:glycosyltransferase 2 family protein